MAWPVGTVMHGWAYQTRSAPAGDLGAALRALLATMRPLWWAPHLPLLIVPLVAGAPHAHAWPLGLLLWASAGLVAAAATARAVPLAVPASPWAAWRLGIGVLGLAAATSVAPLAGAAVALYGALLLAAARAHPSDAL